MRLTFTKTFMRLLSIRMLGIVSGDAHVQYLSPLALSSRQQSTPILTWTPKLLLLLFEYWFLVCFRYNRPRARALSTLFRMQSTRSTSRVLKEIPRAARRSTLSGSSVYQRRQHSSQSSQYDSLRNYRILIYSVLGLGAGTAIFHGSRRLGFEELHAEAPPAPVEITIEKPRKTKGLSKEQNRDVISSQHLQVKRSWENPGLYAWGSNSGGVVAPDSNEAYIKQPRRIPCFDGLLLRDVKLDRHFGAAVTENGDLLQWGLGIRRMSGSQWLH